MRRALADSSASWRTSASEVGWVVVNVIFVPPSKSMPRFRPLKMSAPMESVIRTPAVIANQIRRLPT